MNWTIWKKIALPLILAVVALAFWLLAGRQSPSDLNRRAGVPQPVPVEGANVERGPMGLRCTFSGALESPAELLVAPKVGGRVERLAETETAYGNFVLAEQQIAIFDSSLAVARREQALIEARSELEERRLRLLRLLNPNPEDAFEQRIDALSQPRTEMAPLTDLAERLQLAEKLRPDLNQARLQLQQQALETIVTRNGLLPRLDFFITLGKTGYADSFATSFRGLDGNTYDLAAGLSLSHSLGNRAAKARHQAAQASQRQAEQAVANLRQLVRLDVRLAANELERARQHITASAATSALQEQTLVAEQERFEAGTSTSLLVSQTQRDLLVSQIAEVRAIVNYRIAPVNLFLAEGSLLERRGIEVGS